MRAEIKQVMREVFTLPADALPDDASQQSLRAWDSLRHLNLVIALEARFDVSFEPEEIAMMTSLALIEDLLAQKRK